MRCYSGKGDKFDPLTCNRQSNKMCLKKIYDSGEIQRGCAVTSSVKAAKVNADECVSFSGGEDCFCSEELCNSGNKFYETKIH